MARAQSICSKVVTCPVHQVIADQMKRLPMMIRALPVRSAR
jgi:hypothetical protein